MHLKSLYIMAFEDDMIDAGYSDEEEYLERLIDDFENDFRRQQEKESNYDESYLIYDEDEERERIENRKKIQFENEWVNNWRNNNYELSIIWNTYFRSISNIARNCEYGCYSKPLNEYEELNKWIQEREQFEKERRKEDWTSNLQKIFSLFEDDLFNYYFPESDENIMDSDIENLINDPYFSPKFEEHIKVSTISNQYLDLLVLQTKEPLLWEKVCQCYRFNIDFSDEIEFEVFWEEVYNQDMDYDYWKDSYPEQYDSFAERIIASDDYIIRKWAEKYKDEEIVWKQNNQDSWNRFKRNYEIREINERIYLKIEEHNASKYNYLTNDADSVEFDSRLDDDDVIETNYFRNIKIYLPNRERQEAKSYDINQLDEELYKVAQDCISSIDMDEISKKSSKYADKVLRQLWIHAKRDEWEFEAIKKWEANNSNKPIIENDKYTINFFEWYKKKYNSKWNEYLETKVPMFKEKFDTVMKFRLWALDGNKSEFILLAQKHLLYWNKALQFMYGELVKKQLYDCFLEERNSFSLYGDESYHIKRYMSVDLIEIWKREFKDKIIWNFLHSGGKIEINNTYEIFKYVYDAGPMR